ncbi:MAG: SufD family Fe-S cluster assembly protein [Thermodesulfobacteriota bacterium]|nr:SufD family Fe-S cluster assembly protein [Thermodesulfobacteriota bacterium]
MLSALDKQLLEKVADLHDVPKGAYNIRRNGEGVQRNTTANIDIVTKTDKPGIDILVKPGTKGESVHIPVILSAEGMKDVVYNTFEIGEGADVLIVAGCGIHNAGGETEQHDGVHEFFIRKGARIRYVEKHYGEGPGTGKRVLNPKTVIHAEDGAVVELELVQIMGVDDTRRDTEITLADRAKLVITERLLTDFSQKAASGIDIRINGEDASAQVISRSVARGNSRQEFLFNLDGYSRCRGHIQCDAIIMDNAVVISTPRIGAFCEHAQLVHEAAIGRLESQQLLKLMSLGLSEKEAEDTILKGFLK